MALIHSDTQNFDIDFTVEDVHSPVAPASPVPEPAAPVKRPRPDTQSDTEYSEAPQPKKLTFDPKEVLQAHLEEAQSELEEQTMLLKDTQTDLDAYKEKLQAEEERTAKLTEKVGLLKKKLKKQKEFFEGQLRTALGKVQAWYQQDSKVRTNETSNHQTQDLVPDAQKIQESLLMLCSSTGGFLKTFKLLEKKLAKMNTAAATIQHGQSKITDSLETIEDSSEKPIQWKQIDQLKSLLTDTDSSHKDLIRFLSESDPILESTD